MSGEFGHSDVAGSGGGGGAPSGAAGGDLAGTYPNPTVKASVGLTGTPTAPTAAQGTNTTQIASTAMVHSEAVLLAPLASPTFTGTPSLPTGTTGVTQTTGDSSTKLATTAYVNALAGAGTSIAYPDGTFMPFPFATISGTGSALAATNGGRGTRFTCPKTGTLTKITVGIVASSGNIDVGIYDTGDASAGNRSQLWHAGSTACGSANSFQTDFSPNLSVTAGKEYDFVVSADNSTCSFLKSTGLPNAAHGTLPAAYDAVAGGATAKQFWIATSVFPLPGTIAEASCATIGFGFWFVGKIT